MKYFIFLLFVVFSITEATTFGVQEEMQASQSPELLHNSGNPPTGAEAEFSTDFSKSLINFDEIFSGGPPKDGIPAINEPVFQTIAEAAGILAENEPVLTVSLADETRIYPLRVLMWHEIVNDRIADIPVAVTYCPLCNTGIAFDSRSIAGELDFGTTGRLRFSNLIMYDRQTETWWQQADGEALIGELAGEKLKMIPALMLSWKQAVDTFPNAMVLSSDTGWDRPYGRNPYAGYDSSLKPFLYTGPSAGNEYKSLDRILAIESREGPLSVAYSELEEDGIMMFPHEKIVVFYEEITASALDAPVIADGENIGSALAFSTILDGNELEFILSGGKIKDTNTGSVWSVAGRGISGPLRGKSLEAAVAVNHFWFSFNAFYSLSQ